MNRAPTDLCGGRSAVGVPTAIVHPFPAIRDPVSIGIPVEQEEGQGANDDPQIQR